MAGGPGPRGAAAPGVCVRTSVRIPHLALHPESGFRRQPGKGSLGGDRLRDQTTFRARAARRRIPHRPDCCLVHRGAVQPLRRCGVGNSGRARGATRFHPHGHRTAATRGAWVMTRRWLALGVLSLGVLVIGVDGTVLAGAPPFLSQGIETTGGPGPLLCGFYPFWRWALVVPNGRPRHPP